MIILGASLGCTGAIGELRGLLSLLDYESVSVSVMSDSATP